MCVCVCVCVWSSRKLTERQRELIVEYARTEQLENGTVNGVKQGLLFVQECHLAVGEPLLLMAQYFPFLHLPLP